MQIRPTEPHPGPFRLTDAAPEFAGIMLAIGFVLMGLVGIMIAKFFRLGAIVLGGAVALLPYLVRR